MDGGFESMLRRGGPLPPGLSAAVNGKHQQALSALPPVALVSHCTHYRIAMMDGSTHDVAVLGTVNKCEATIVPTAHGPAMTTLLIPVALACISDPMSEEPMEDNLVLWHGISELQVLRPFNEAEMAATQRRQEKSQKV